MAKSKKNKDKYISQEVAQGKYHLTKQQIEKYLPAPVLSYDPRRPNLPPKKQWKESVVRDIIEGNENIQREIEEKRAKNKQRANKRAQRIKDANEFLSSFSPEDLLERGSLLERRFVLHVGPTNT